MATPPWQWSFPPPGQANRQQQSRLKSEMERIAKRATTYFHQENFAEASNLYSEALPLAAQLGDESDIALILLNLSSCFLRLGRFDLAFFGAQEAISVHPTRLKGYDKAGEAALALQSFNQALEFLRDGYLMAVGLGRPLDKEPLTFLLRMAEVIPNVPVGDVEMILHSVQPVQSLRNMLVERLVAEQKWELVHAVFFCGGGGYRPNSGGIVTGCDASMINLGTLLYLYMAPPLQSICDTIRDTIRVLLQHGSGLGGFTLEQGDTPMHALLKVELGKGEDSLPVMTIICESLKTRFIKALQATDAKGNTLLHVVAMADRERQTIQRCALRAIRLLLNAGLDADVRNADGKRADHYARRGSEVFLCLERGSGEGLKSEMERIAACATAYFRQENFVEACNLHTEALQLARQLGDGSDFALILLNRSSCFLRLGRFDLALSDAQEVIGTRPIRLKGYYKAGDASLALQSFNQALEFFRDGYLKAVEIGRPLDNEPLTFLLRMAEVIPKVPVLSDVEMILLPVQPVQSLRTMLVERLVAEQKWELVHIVFFRGGAGYRSNNGGIASGCDASKIDHLAPLLLLYSASPRPLEFIGDTIRALLQHGSGLGSFSLEQGDTPMHALLKVELRKGDDSLPVMTMVCESLKARFIKALQATDAKGNTLLHVVAMADRERQTSQRCALRAIRLLLNAGLDADVCNADGKRAEHCARRGSDIFLCLERGSGEVLKSEMERIAACATEHFRQENFAKACHLYTEALQLARQLGHGSDLALILLNRSSCFLRLGRFDLALSDAQEAIRTRPTRLKGYHKAGDAALEMQLFNQALMFIRDGYLKAVELGRPLDKEPLAFLVRMAEVIPKVLVGDVEMILLPVQPVQSLRTILVERLVTEQKWELVHGVFFRGGGGYKPNSGGIATGCDASMINLAPLLHLYKGAPSPRCVGDTIHDIRNTIHALLKHGSELGRFSLEQGDTPMHALLKVELGKGEDSLPVMTMVCESLRSRFTNALKATDAKGNTLLHVVVMADRERQTRKNCALRAIRLLLDAGLDADISNADGKRAEHYARRGTDLFVCLKRGRGEGMHHHHDSGLIARYT
ncbi:PREDICTED: uncharacterized protein LOC109483679 [Branchiostoma belcheri]|uniref:Uncharacterized protein LOC109483679 n=1 Tax=Branchiostoma belcheri TaxID=7741 RepID=A0A6P4ZM42_BRABE|nr:PREDICTED: uncharacterized protein LOC109483679 [Branchiostoma belcheri]